MSREFLLPDLGEGLTEAEIVSWLVAPGDVIVIDQPVVEVESAKSVVELPSPYAGRVEALHAGPGDVVHKGSILITVASPVEGVVEPEQPDVVPGTALRAREAEPTGSGAVLIGYGTKESTVRLKRPAGGRFGNRTSAPSPLAPAGTLLDPERHSPVVSPLVRKQARLHGIDATQLAGTGPGALVLRADVDVAIAALETSLAAPSHVLAVSPVPAAGDQRVQMSAMRKLIAQRLGTSRRTIPEATIWLDVDATELFAAKDRLQKSTGERFSLTALIARFVVAGLAEFPILNSSVDEEASEIIRHGSIGLGLAAQTSRGLMVPVIHDAGSLTTRQLRDRVAEVVAHSDKGDFPAAQLRGGTFTLNNYGGFGVDGSTPIINYPEVAMLGIGRMIDRPWVVDGELAVRKVVTVSFVFDHRVCDGDVASGFINFVARCIEEPLTLLGSL
ncbi:MAG TPA: dihydrolipoamide acetyltransferase family protein [Galbitalea sp.]|jgi:pyruvate dehydrogenase E2 component (dihydrolipoamide acetyltransferase)